MHVWNADTVTLEITAEEYSFLEVVLEFAVSQGMPNLGPLEQAGNSLHEKLIEALKDVDPHCYAQYRALWDRLEIASKADQN